MAEEVLYAHQFTSEDARPAAIAVSNIHYDHHRPHGAAAGKPPAARLRESVTSVEPQAHASKNRAWSLWEEPT
jgi:hypothetical protein